MQNVIPFRIKPASRIIAFDVNGFQMMVGLDAPSNEAMVDKHKSLHGECLWFHAVGCVGPHAVLCLEGIEPDEETIKMAAQELGDRTFKEGVLDRWVRMARLKHVAKPLNGKEGSWMAYPYMILRIV